MSFLSKLIIDGEELILLSCHFGFSQGTDYTGRPSEIPRGGQLDLLIEGTSNTNFLEWVKEASMTKSGKIIFGKREDEGILKTIDFEETHCINYDEYFDHNSKQPLSIKLKLSAGKISVNGVPFANNWHKA